MLDEKLSELCAVKYREDVYSSWEDTVKDLEMQIASFLIPHFMCNQKLI